MALKLTYFPLPGRAFATRVCFGIGGIEYEDERIPGPVFAERKAAGDFPMGSVPILTLPSGKKVVESGAIARYAANRAGLYPKDAEQQLIVDEIVELCGTASGKVPYDKDPEEKKKNRTLYAEGALKTTFTLVASRLSESGGPFFLGEEFSLADIQFYGLVKMLRSGFIDHIPLDYDSAWPVIQTLIDALEGNARFAPYKI